MCLYLPLMLQTFFPAICGYGRLKIKSYIYIYISILTGINTANDSGTSNIPAMPKTVPMLCGENPKPPIYRNKI